MSNTREVQWRAEFEKDGRTLVRDAINRGIYSDEPKHQAAIQWLREQDRNREAREAQMARYGWWTLWVGVIAAIAASIAAWPVIREWIR
jgi:hypothetical protein